MAHDVVVLSNYEPLKLPDLPVGEHLLMVKEKADHVLIVTNKRLFKYADGETHAVGSA